MEAFGAYGRALEAAGVLLSGDVLQPTAATTTVTRRDGGPPVQDGPFAETKEALAGVFVLDAPDLDAAIGWAEQCPGAQWGVVEVRPSATAGQSGCRAATPPAHGRSRLRRPWRRGRPGSRVAVGASSGMSAAPPRVLVRPVPVAVGRRS